MTSDKITQSTRRKFIQKAGAAGLASTIGLAACSTEKKAETGPYINFNNTYRWKMTTTWPPNFPVVGAGCKRLADWVKEMSGGRMEITVYGAGELIPPLEGFDAVSSGAVEMNHGAAYYWAGKSPAAQFFTAVPFGMNAPQMCSWIVSGGAQALWEELYAPFGLKPFLCGNTGMQMGGWFNKEINSIQDLQGLKMRMPGLGGKVLSKAGGPPMLVSGGEIYTNLERGVLDATEWIGPYHDYLMGFHQVASHYYYPGWHETGPVLELIVNKSKFEALPRDLQEIIYTVCFRANTWMTTEFDVNNGIYLKKLIEEEGIQPKPFPDDVLNRLKTFTTETLDELAANDPAVRKVYDAYKVFRDGIAPWLNISEKVFYEKIM
jgi:TRAP-type mannitol/chloroaromatic compound transport system substrate-binding protein